MFWLDWKLFGNGCGMASPFFDDAFYWLHDGGPAYRGGRFYRWFGGFGAQMHSVEWFAPKAGTRRRLFGHDFVVFSTHRKWLRVEVSWALVRGVGEYSDVGALRQSLQTWGHGQ
ncbi:MAG: hypothetical protein GEV06_16625 [Luteitalea sp.]|nr:hypothetical protein [Luteitalea sp.]